MDFSTFLISPDSMIRARRHFYPLLLAILFIYIFAAEPFAAQTPFAPVSIKTKDGLQLAATYAKPAVGKPVVVMLHGLASVKEEWNSFATYAASQGWGTLAYDARGHGASSKSKDMNGNPNGFQYFGRPGPGSEWSRMVDDVGAAVAFLRIDQKLSDVPIHLCGASLGANVVLNYIALTHSIKSGALLSPGMNFAGFETEEALTHVTSVPILLVASSADVHSYESCVRLSRLRKGIPFWSDVKPGHGVQMLDEKLTPRLFAWFAQQK